MMFVRPYLSYRVWKTNPLAVSGACPRRRLSIYSETDVIGVSDCQAGHSIPLFWLSTGIIDNIEMTRLRTG